MGFDADTFVLTMYRQGVFVLLPRFYTLIQARDRYGYAPERLFGKPKTLSLDLLLARILLGKLSHCAWTCIRAKVRRLLGRDGARVAPGMIAAIQTDGELLH